MSLLKKIHRKCCVRSSPYRSAILSLLQYQKEISNQQGGFIVRPPRNGPVFRISLLSNKLLLQCCKTLHLISTKKTVLRNLRQTRHFFTAWMCARSVQVQSRDLWPGLKVNRVMYVRFLNRSQTDINCSAVVIDPRQLFLSGSRGNDILFSLL